jgi:hypothetical protein
MEAKAELPPAEQGPQRRNVPRAPAALYGRVASGIEDLRRQRRAGRRLPVREQRLQPHASHCHAEAKRPGAERGGVGVS